jgi:hypothetical protein
MTRSTLIHDHAALRDFEEQRVRRVPEIAEVGGAARNDIGDDLRLLLETPGQQRVELCVRNPVRDDHQKVPVAIGPCHCARATAEEPDLFWLPARDHSVQETPDGPHVDTTTGPVLHVGRRMLPTRTHRRGFHVRDASTPLSLGSTATVAAHCPLRAFALLARTSPQARNNSGSLAASQNKFLIFYELGGRGERIRTSDLLVPNQAL